MIFLLDLSTLNEQQKRAVTSQSQYLRVIAGAGSGKTRVLTYRIAYLIQHLGIADKTILAITFTNKAASEMKHRVAALLNNYQLSSHISTFHSFCARLLREDIKLLNYPTSFVIIDEEDQHKIVSDLIKKFDLDKEMFSVKGVISYISNFKSEAISYEQAYKYAHGLTGEEMKAKLYEHYEKYLSENHYLDFDDLILKAVLILEKFPKAREKWQSRFSNILVDEFQDTNWIQFRLIQYLASSNTSVLVVGDPDQTIYTWRGADVSIILDFPNMFKGTEDVFLNLNYRSTQTILECANALIKNNTKRVHKDLSTVNKVGTKNIYYRGESTELEAIWVVERIFELAKNNPNLKYSDFAILYRSNFYSRAFETALNRFKIPYLIFGGIRFFERKEVKDVMAYLRLIVRDDDNLAFERVVNTPKRGVGEKTIEVIKIRAAQENHPYYVQLKKTIDDNKNQSLKKFVQLIEDARRMLNSPGCQYYEIVDFIVKQSGLMDLLIELNEDERIENINELASYLKQMQENNPYLPLIEIIQELSLLSSQDEIKDKNYVSMMTVHTAKGLEFPYVFVVGLAEGIFPSGRAMQDGNSAVEEERRLAYVAFTRAKNQLFLSDTHGINFRNNSNWESSRFIGEVFEFLSPYYNSEKYQEPIRRSNIIKPSERSLKPQLTTNEDFRNGDLVIHDTFGEGVIISISSNVLTIAFKDQSYGTKSISKSFGGLRKAGRVN